jgi:hypothetical protein
MDNEMSGASNMHGGNKKNVRHFNLNIRKKEPN